jgi:hypothetical protein
MKFACSTIVALTKSLLKQLRYFNGENPVIPANFTKGGKYPFILITGENACGKSFIRRLYQQSLKLNGIECIHLSQQGRSSGGIMRCMVYGSEDDESTGAITSHIVIAGIKNCIDRTNKHLILWDEPDIGLSDSYAAGVGKKIREFIKDLPELTFGVIVITHNKHLIRQLLPLKPNHLRLGDNKTLNEFLNEAIEPKNLDELQEKAHKTWKDINKILSEIKK